MVSFPSLTSPIVAHTKLLVLLFQYSIFSSELCKPRYGIYFIKSWTSPIQLPLGETNSKSYHRHCFWDKLKSWKSLTLSNAVLCLQQLRLKEARRPEVTGPLKKKREQLCASIKDMFKKSSFLLLILYFWSLSLLLMPAEVFFFFFLSFSMQFYSFWINCVCKINFGRGWWAHKERKLPKSIGCGLRDYFLTISVKSKREDLQEYIT